MYMSMIVRTYRCCTRTFADYAFPTFPRSLGSAHNVDAQPVKHEQPDAAENQRLAATAAAAWCFHYPRVDD